MTLQAQQIVALACQQARAPGFTSQAGQQLNLILQELAETYDFDVARGTTVLTLSSGSSGPYTLPADYLRSDPNEVFFTVNGVPYPLIPEDLAEYDAEVQTPGLAAYPCRYATDMSQSPPVLYCYPPANGALPLTVRYRRAMPDITTPETSTAVPWFPFQGYLVRRLAGELMGLTNDERMASFLGDEPQFPEGAQAMLKRYLRMKDDQSNRAQTVKLDRRRFGPRFDSLPNTKKVGW